MSELDNILMKNIARRNKHNAAFQRTFHVKLHRYWNNVTGFDSVKFDDEVVNPPDGISTAYAIKSRYGADAVAMIRDLIGLEK